MERIIKLEQAANVRDLGGYETVNDRKVNYKKLIRSASLADLTEKDQRTLGDYGVVTVVDFRSPEEEEKEPDKAIPGATNLFMPVFSTDETESTIAPTQLFQKLEQGFTAEKQMVEVYEHFVEADSARQTYRKFFETILSNEDPAKSVLFHCTAGKDRTGFGAAMFLAALGVPQEEIYKNYLETNVYMAAKTDTMIKQAIDNGAPELLVAGIRQLMAADKQYLDASFASIAENFGDVTNFLQEGLQLSQGDLNLLEELYTTK